MSERYKIVISDCHLSAGRFYGGNLNPHEDFHCDGQMVGLFEYFSKGKYETAALELVIAGDFMDFLNVPIGGEFEDVVTEEVALRKLEAIIQGHPKVMRALREFAARPGKSICYLIGNHDADLFFAGVRERIVREWDPEGRYPSPNVRVIADVDRITLPEGVEIRHGNQFEAQSALNFQQPVLSGFLDRPILNLPWSSLYVMKIINRLRWEREHIDKVRPVKVFILFNLILDPWFTLRYLFLSAIYFLRTRFVWSPKRRSSLRQTLEILKQELRVFLDLEREAREVLLARNDLKTIIFGHTHRPMDKVYPDGKQYINTGTWTRMINLDWGQIGQSVRLTFAWIRLADGQAQCELRQWVGEHSPHIHFPG